MAVSTGDDRGVTGVTRKAYVGEGIAVTWEPRLCIHTARCTRGLPAVFESARRPWIDPNGAPADEIAALIERCPSGALSYRRLDGGAQEQPAAVTTVEPQRNGPLYVRGRFRVEVQGEVREMTRASLCRCGFTGNAPFCDNSHLRAGFAIDG